MKLALAITLVGITLAFTPGCGYNTLATEREAVSASFSQVDVAMQRRADLIPNLVKTVKGFAKQEQSVIDSVTAARAALGGAKTPAEKIAANGQIDSALSRLLVVVENYPDIKSNQNFRPKQISTRFSKYR